MKYLCLVCVEETKLHAMPKAELDGMIAEHLAHDEILRRNGNFLTAAALQSVRTATTVRVRNGRTTVTDGPFAETKEQVGGFYLLEARDLNEAIQLAAKIPSARHGCVEIRPVWELVPAGGGSTA